MNTKVFAAIVAGSALLLAPSAGWAQSGAYSNAVLSLNPAGYWPMHEIEAPASGDIETNYGTLGALGDAYYGDWVLDNNAFMRQMPGALPNDPDPSVFFRGGPNNNGHATNSLVVPHTSPLATLVPPFTVECWIMATNNYKYTPDNGTGQGDIWSQDDLKVNGIRLYYQNSPGDSINVLVYANSAGRSALHFPELATNEWHQVVVTCDATTNMTAWYDGLQGNSVNYAGNYNPETGTPFTVGNGLVGNGNPGSRGWFGFIDEVSVYTNALDGTRIYQHYSDGISGLAGTYFQDVTNDNPVIYLRMNSLPYTAPDAGTWPAMMNYGSAGGNGIYSPGTLPGIVAGPANAEGLPYAGLSGNYVSMLSGMSSFGVAGSASAFNPTGSTPFTVSALFRGNPTDRRVQSIVGHGVNSWELGLTEDGRIVFNPGVNITTPVATGSGTGDLVSTTTNNEGGWHLVTAVHNGTANVIYIDGVADNTNVVTSDNLGNSLNVLIGSDPSYTNSPVALGRQFGGQICDVAFFTNALTPSQVLDLYSLVGILPAITTQPQSIALNEGGAYTNTVAASGSPVLGYHWFYNSSSNYAGATMLSDNARITGTATATLVNSDAVGADAGYYFAVATNAFGSATSSIVSLIVNAIPAITNVTPAIYTNQFVLYVGSSPTFAVGAVGAEPLAYQWYTNGVAVTAATNASFTLDNVQLTASENVLCVVTNQYSSVTSSPAWTFSVIAAPVAPYPQAVLADHPIDYWRMNEPDDGLFNGNAGVISLDYAGGKNGIYTNVTLGQLSYNSTTDPSDTSVQFGETGISFIDSYDGSIQGVDFSAPTNFSSDFSVEAWVYPTSQSYSGAGIISKGYGNGGEQFDLDVYSGAYRFLVRDAAGAVHSAASTNPIATDGWHHIVGVCNETLGIVALYDNGQEIASTFIVPGSGIMSTPEPVSIGSRRSNSSVTNYDLQYYGGIDDVALYNYALSPEQVRQHWSSSGVAPIFTVTPPSLVTLSAGSLLTLPAEVIGTPPLTVSWDDIFNATNIFRVVVTDTNLYDATLVVSNVPEGWDFDTLELSVTNAYGTIYQDVTLSVGPGAPPVISKDLPPQVAVAAGSTYMYSIGVTGSGPDYFQWYQGSSPLIGQTSSTYTATAGAAGSSDTYFVVITNIYGAVTSSVSTLTSFSLPSLSGPYATYLLSLNPVGYWPLQETNAPVPAAFETNYGTLGRIGDAFYASTNTSDISFAQPGVLAGSSNTCVSFNGVLQDSWAFVPRVSPALTLQPPISLECWFMSSLASPFGDLIGEGGSGLNTPPNTGNGGGIRLSYGGGSTPNMQLYIFNGNGLVRNQLSTPANSVPLGAWHYVVATYDGTTAKLYIDGTLQASNTFVMALDTWSPLSFGNGFWQGNKPTRAYNGLEDEIAIYTNALSAAQVTDHYLAGTTSGSNYMQTVLGDSPMLYYRMDAASYINPNSLIVPAAANYGSAPVQGLYRPDAVPGGVEGPAYPGFGTTTPLAVRNDGILSCVDAGSDPAFGPTGTQPFTAMTWFKGYPAFGTVESLMSQGGVNSWALNLDGTTGHVVWNSGAGSVTSSGILNDGTWHFVVGVYDGTANTLYVDGAPDGSIPASGTVTGNAGEDVFLGGDPDYTLIGVNQQFFAGALAQAAFLTNALTATQVSDLYNAAVTPIGPPTISVTRNGSQLSITFTGTLLSSTNIAGPYSPVSGTPSSPYIVTPSGPQIFYRSSNQ